MACYPGPGYYGPFPGPYGPGPCGVCVGPCACGPCPPLYSGVGKCFPPTRSPCSAQELSLYPMTGTPTGSQMLYSNNTQGTTTITSVQESGSSTNATYTVNVSLANVRNACTLNGTITVVYLAAGLGNRKFTASTSIIPYATTATLTFSGLPAFINGAGTIAFINLTYS